MPSLFLSLFTLLLSFHSCLTGSKYESISTLINQITENWPIIIEDFQRLIFSPVKYSLIKGNFSHYESSFSIQFSFNTKSENFDEASILNFKSLSIPQEIHSKLLTQIHSLDTESNYGFTAYDILYTPYGRGDSLDFAMLFIEHEEDIGRYHTISLHLKTNYKYHEGVVAVNESPAYNFFPFSQKCIVELNGSAEYEVDAISKYFQMVILKKFAELFGVSLSYPSF